MEWICTTFNTDKPIIAMCHFQALPGDPYFDQAGGMRKVIDFAREELTDLQEGGVDAVMFSNEFSLPYLTKVLPETTAAMARVIGRINAVDQSTVRRECFVGPLCVAGSCGSHRREVHS